MWKTSSATQRLPFADAADELNLSPQQLYWLCAEALILCLPVDLESLPQQAAAATDKGCVSIVGGGDSVAAVEKAGKAAIAGLAASAVIASVR